MWPHLIHGTLGPPNSTSQMASQLVQPFLHSTWQRVPILYNRSPLLPLKIAPLRGDLNPHLIHGSLGLPKSISQMASWSVEPFLDSSRSWQTDKLTDHDTPSVTKGRMYVALRCGLMILTTTMLITMCLFKYIMSSLKHTNIHTVKQSAFKQLLITHLFQSKLVTMHCDYLLTCTLNVLLTCLLSCTYSTHCLATQFSQLGQLSNSS